LFKPDLTWNPKFRVWFRVFRFLVPLFYTLFFTLFNALVPTTVHIGAQKRRDAQGDGFLCAFVFFLHLDRAWVEVGRGKLTKAKWSHILSRVEA
jgi:hypothetical protein